LRIFRLVELPVKVQPTPFTRSHLSRCTQLTKVNINIQALTPSAHTGLTLVFLFPPSFRGRQLGNESIFQIG